MDYTYRPPSVPVVSWIWIVSGIFVVVSGVIGMGALSDLSGPPAGKSLHGPPTPALAVMAGLSRFLIWTTVVQMLMAVLAIVAGIYYLKLRSWARGVLELLTWVSLAALIGFGFFWPPAWMMTSSRFLPNDGSIDLQQVKYIGAIAGVVVMVAAAVPLAMMIRSLRSKAVREAIRRAAGGS